MSIRKTSVLLLFLIPVCVLLLRVSRSGVARAAASEQVVFAGQGGVFTDDSLAQPITPFGFWIWCQGASANQYDGECSGAMYFYALGITKGVKGTVTGSGSVFTMNVHSKDGSVNCSLVNATPVLSGPSNLVTVTCTAPSQVADSSDHDTTGVITNAVVNITGPGN